MDAPAETPEAVLAGIAADVAADAAPSGLIERLRGLEPAFPEGAAGRAAFLRLRGIVLNRLGLFKEALGDLHEARRICEGAGDADGARATSLEIGRVFAWRGDSRESALALLAVFAGARPSDAAAMRGLVEAAALNLEIGRYAEARRLLADVLAAPNGLGPDELARARVMLVRTLVRLKDLAEAEAAASGVDLAGVSQRLGHRLALERVLVAIGRRRLDEAEAVLAALRRKVPADTDSFESVEIREIEAHYALARGRPDEALEHATRVIVRFAEDDLAGREVTMRLLEARILDELGRPEEVAQTLLAALRRAVARDLVGLADDVRERLAERNISVLSWMPGATPTGRAVPSSERFVRRRALGEGGIGSVSVACDLETGEEVALKRLVLADTYDSAVRKRRIESARREAAAASRIQHPGVGRVYGFMLEESGDGVLVRELVPGPTLREALATSLPIDIKLTLLTELAQAIVAVHAAGVVHRDLKPENVVLRSDRHPVLIDFGASAFGATKAPGDFSTLYAAPEQMGTHLVDARADIYAFATIAFELITGGRPEHPRGLAGVLGRGGRARRRRRDLVAAGCPVDAARFIVQALAPRPTARPRGVEPFIEALRLRR